MADEIEQMNRILSPKPGGTGDDVYAGAIDPREVGVDALNAGALSDEEFMMAEEFMNALPEEAKESFIDRLINDPRATIMSIMDTLGQVFSGGSVEGDPNPMMGSLSSIGSGSTSNAELDAYRNAMNVEGSGAMTDAELDAFRKMKMNMDVSPPSGAMTDRELDFIRQQQMDMNVSPPSGAMTDEERAIRRQRMSMDN
jgi:hypothetical protein